MALIDGRRYDFFICDNALFEYGLSAHAIAVYVFLCRRAGAKEDSWPSHADIAQHGGMSVSSVQRAIKELVMLKLLTVVSRRAEGRPCAYQIQRATKRGGSVAGTEGSVAGTEGSVAGTDEEDVLKKTPEEDTCEVDVGDQPLLEHQSTPRVEAKSPKARIKFDRRTGALAGIEAGDRARWAGLYPAVDLDHELARAAEWLLNNPERVRSNIAQYLTNWLQRSQDRAATRPAAAAEPKKRTAWEEALAHQPPMLRT